jgi:lysine 6-dehydrogenase
MRIVPREFTAAVMAPHVRARQGDPDVCIMWNTVCGEHRGRPVRFDYYLWGRADEASGLSAMGRTTGFPCAIAAVMAAKGQIRQRGVLAPEDALDEAAYEELMAHLKQRNINIQEIRRDQT